MGPRMKPMPVPDVMCGCFYAMQCEAKEPALTAIHVHTEVSLVQTPPHRMLPERERERSHEGVR